MKDKGYAMLVTGICVFSMICGIGMKSTYTDITADSDYTGNMKVAELPEELAKSVTDNMKNILPESKYIIRAKATGEERHIFHLFMQKVEIQQIYKSEGETNLEEGQCIYITKAGWRCYFDEMSVEYGFVNKMQEGKEYLIFLDHKADSTLDRDVEYDVYDLGEHIIDPVFCYDDMQNQAFPVRGENTYVDYKEVCGNEFFGCTDTSIEYMISLKKEMIEKYN